MDHKFRKLRKGGRKSDEQKEALAKINKLINVRAIVIRLFHGYTTIAPETRYRAIKGEKITPK